MGKNLAWTDRGRLTIAVHNTRPPSDFEWTSYLSYLRSRKDISNQRVLLWTDGGSPDAHQRKGLEEVIRRHFPDPAPMAVLTSSLIVRAVMKLTAIFNPLIKCYTPDQFSTASVYLGLSPSEREFATRKLEVLREKVALEQAAS